MEKLFWVKPNFLVVFFKAFRPSAHAAGLKAAWCSNLKDQSTIIICTVIPHLEGTGL